MTEQAPTNSSNSSAQIILSRFAKILERKPFVPHPLITGGHAQTLAAYAWPRRHKFRKKTDEERLFEVAPGVRVLAHCRWQDDRGEHPTIILWHGIEGSSSSVYMLSMADKGFAAGFNILRMNLRNCGGTEHLTPTLYHGGMSEDLAVVINELIEKDGQKKLVLIGVSLGGNMVLKLGAEYGDDSPREVIGMCALSPSVDLSASAEMICLRSNWLYHQDFVRRLKGRIRLKQKLFPKLYDSSELHLVRTIREFDDRYTARAHGFQGVDDYYRQASSVNLLDHIRIPTLIIHAVDDPFIPFAPLKTSAAVTNPYILLVGTDRGGHVAFVSKRGRHSIPSSSNHHPMVSRTQRQAAEDRFWAENRAIDFCRIAVESSGK